MVFKYTGPTPMSTFVSYPLMYTPEGRFEYFEDYPEHRTLSIPPDYYMVDLTQDYYPVEGYCPAEVPELDLKTGIYKSEWVNGREFIDLTIE